MRRSIVAVPTLTLATALLLGATVALVPHSAWAQFPGGGGGMRPMGPGGQQPGGMEPQKEEEGPAEAAPENQGQEPATQPLPAWPGQREKSLQFFQLNGYIRGRGYFFHAFNLGVPVSTTGVNPPFPVPYSEFGATGMSANPGNMTSCAARNHSNCRSEDLTSADMRFRLEPTVNVSEQVRVKAQIDIFDNMVLGSTPEGYFINGLSGSQDARLSVFSKSQSPPIAGRNSLTPSIVAKRAWAEVRTPIGELRFGRMPSHWGMGMLVNNGDCLDCDYGTNADRAMFVTKFWDHFIALMWDWVATGPTTALYTPNQISGPTYSADSLVNVSQWGLALGRQDKPDELREKVDRGELVVNYGGYFIYRMQDWDLSTNPGVGTGGYFSSPATPAKLQGLLVPRHAWAFIPDLWFRLNWHKLSIEAEGAIIGGRINSITDQVTGAKNGYTVLQYGGVIRAQYKLLRDALHIGLEVGYASGDSWEDPNATVNFRQAAITPPDGATLGKFNFDPDYHVDLILFRRILGTVANATYFKPSVSYDLTDNISGKLDVIYAIANRPVSYPGNDFNLGIELDGSVMYRNEEEGFYIGIVYGVLFPFAGLSIPGSIYPGQNHSPDTAQTVQGRMVVKF